MRLLIDTSIIIDYLRRKDRKESIYIKLIEAEHDLFASIITQAELYSGKSVWEDNKLNHAVGVILRGLNILPLDSELSKAGGRIRAYHKIELNDALIAATAIRNKCELVTLNLKDFEEIPSLKLYGIK